MPYTEVEEMKMKRRYWVASGELEQGPRAAHIGRLNLLLACERKCCGTMHDDIDPRHCTLDRRRVANIRLHDVDQVPLGIIKGAISMDRTLNPRPSRQRHRLMPRNPAPPVTRIDADMASLP